MVRWPMKMFASVTLAFVVCVLPLTVCGTYNLTLAVAESWNTTDTATVERTRISLGNGSFDVTVLWTYVNRHNSFQMTQYLEFLVRQQVDLLILQDELSAAIEETSQTMARTLPPTVTYFQESEGGGGGTGTHSSCLSHPSQSPDSAQDPGSRPCEASLTSSITMADTLVTVIQQLAWTQVVVIFDKGHEMVTKELTENLVDLAVQTLFLSYGTIEHDPQINVSSGSGQGGSLHDLIQSLYDRHDGELRVVLLCSVQCASQVLTEASKFDESNDKRTAMAMIGRWLLILPPRDQHFLESCDLQLDNIAVIVHPPETSYSPVKNIRKELPSIVKSVHDQLMGTNGSLSAANLTRAIIESFQVSQSCYRGYVRTLLWKPEGRRLSDVGYVRHDKILHMASDQEVFPNIKFGLNNRKFIVATLPWPSFVERKRDGTYEGLCVDLLLQLQADLNFSYVWREPEDQQWGVLTPNKTWTGLVGLLERKEVDMVMAPISVQANRENIMDFTYPFYIDYTTVLLKLPDPDDSKWKRLIQPFQLQVHMFIWISLLSVTVLTFLLELINPFYLTNTKTMLHIGDMFWYMFGALLTQGGARLPDSQTGRTMVSAFWLFSIVMAAIYSGNLIAFLTVSIESAPFDSLKAMVEQDDYKWGTLGGTFFITLFEKSPLEVFNKIWKGLERERGSDPDVLSGDPEVHLAKVKAGQYAYIGDKSAISTWLKTECDLITINEEFLPMQYAVGLINNSDYTRLFSDEILQINEMGLTETWIRRWWSKTSFCQGAMMAASTPIQLIDVQSAFYLVFMGIAVSFLVLALEKLSHRFHVTSRLKRVFRGRKAAGPEPDATRWNSSCISFDGTTVTHIRTEDLPERGLGREFQHRNLFYLDTPPAGQPHCNGRAVTGESPAGGDEPESETVFTGMTYSTIEYGDTRLHPPANGHTSGAGSVGRTWHSQSHGRRKKTLNGRETPGGT